MNDGEPVPGDVDGERPFAGRLLVCFAVEWLSDVFEFDFGGYLDFAEYFRWQYEKRTFTTGKAASWEMHVLSDGVRSRMGNAYGLLRFDPEVWCHLELVT